MNASFGPAKAEKRALHVMFRQPFAVNQIFSVFSQTQRVFALTSALQFRLFVSGRAELF